MTLNCMKNPETIPQQILDGLGGAAQYLDGEKAAVRAVRVLGFESLLIARHDVGGLRGHPWIKAACL